MIKLNHTASWNAFVVSFSDLSEAILHDKREPLGSLGSVEMSQRAFAIVSPKAFRATEAVKFSRNAQDS